MITTQFIVHLLLILSAAWVLGFLFSRFGLPAMLGELLAGVILGPPLLGVVHSSDALQLLAELGIFFVMFHSGMDMDPRELLEHIGPSLGVALGGLSCLTAWVSSRPWPLAAPFTNRCLWAWACPSRP